VVWLPPAGVTLPARRARAPLGISRATSLILGPEGSASPAARWGPLQALATPPLASLGPVCEHWQSSPASQSDKRLGTATRPRILASRQTAPSERGPKTLPERRPPHPADAVEAFDTRPTPLVHVGAPGSRTRPRHGKQRSGRGAGRPLHRAPVRRGIRALPASDSLCPHLS